MTTIKKKLSPQQRLREKLYPIKFSEDIEKPKKRVSLEELLRLAKKVRKTFKDEYIPQPSTNL